MFSINLSADFDVRQKLPSRSPQMFRFFPIPDFHCPGKNIADPWKIECCHLPQHYKILSHHAISWHRLDDYKHHLHYLLGTCIILVFITYLLLYPVDITHCITFNYYTVYFYVTQRQKTSLGALCYHVLIVTSQTNVDFYIVCLQK
jgi:hypothetical protein